MAKNDKSSALWVTANERFKSKSGDWMAIGVIAAVLAHAALFLFAPSMSAEDVSVVSDETEVITPPEVEIPPPPEQISRPATPRVAAANIEEDITIARTTFESNPVENLPPPPAGARPSEVPSYIPRDVEPVLKNRATLIRLAQQRYPSMLREAGISGTVGVYFFVAANGEVTNAVVQKSSGYPQFDQVALDIAQQGEFQPAMNRDKPVGVWIVLPIQFSTR
ncbi:MAG: energy transducer TonB [Gemmatimonadales bacterium]|jgi:protein TonB